MHLWEANHPYYCSESNYYSNEPYTKHDTWPNFLAEFKNSDTDLNMIFRFDWKEDDEDGKNTFNGDPYYRNGTLQIFFVFQRKGIFACHEISVCRADEPSVIEFLTPRWKYMQALWEPICPAPAEV